MSLLLPIRSASPPRRTPRRKFGRYPEIGTLGMGKIADIAVIEDQPGVRLRGLVAGEEAGLAAAGTGSDCPCRPNGSRRTIEAAPQGARDITIYDLVLSHPRIEGHSRHVDIPVIGKSRCADRTPAALQKRAAADVGLLDGRIVCFRQACTTDRWLPLLGPGRRLHGNRAFVLH
jgi:hypothetical protein